MTELGAREGHPRSEGCQRPRPAPPCAHRPGQKCGWSIPGGGPEQALAVRALPRESDRCPLSGVQVGWRQAGLGMQFVSAGGGGGREWAVKCV